MEAEAVSFSLIQPLHSIPIAGVDVETTGASAELGDRVIEVGIARYENGVKVAEYQQLIDPHRQISSGVSALTGITQSMCEGQPTFASQFPAMSGTIDWMCRRAPERAKIWSCATRPCSVPM